MLKNIEFNILLFGFMTNFVWEMLQMPLFIFPADISITSINLLCLKASLGDAFMLIVMYWILAVSFKSRHWIYHLSIFRIGIYLAIGIFMTVIFEALAIGPLQRWTYGPLMPTLPLIGIGLGPIIQWLTIPLFVLWLLRRQLNQY